MNIPRIQAIGTAVPEYALEQKEIKEFVAAIFYSHINNLDRLLPIFENSRIQVRHFSQPLDWYSKRHSFAEANKLFEQRALELGEKAALEAMRKAAVKPENIGMVIFISSTGIATPTLDAKIIERLGLSSNTKRLPIWGLGCAGGVAGLARAAELSQSLEEKSVLLITVELCSLTFQQSDFSKSNLVGTSIFADGAAAALITKEGDGPVILGNYSTLFWNSADIMGWDLIDSGFKVRFSRNIPSIIRQHLPYLLRCACEKWGIEQDDIKHYIVHPGGAKVLSAYMESLGLNSDQLDYAYRILENYGNMSSPTVLFVLEKLMTESSPTNDYGVLLTMGPGFSAEQALFKW